MRILGLCFAPLLVYSGTVAAQIPDDRLHADQRAVALSAIEWYASRLTELKESEGTLVISGLTSGFESAPPDSASVRLLQRPPRSLEIGGATLEALADHTSLRVASCDSIGADHSLCGIQRPWIWVVVSAPGIEGDQAIVALEDRWLEVGPQGRVDRMGSDWDILLERRAGRWTVVSGTRVGVS
jgi:hypothetical protein